MLIKVEYSTKCHIAAKHAMLCAGCLQARAMDDLEVNNELPSVVIEDEDTDTASARCEGALEAVPEVGLVNDGNALLDVTGLGHGDNCIA
jgi:hypothetical protein